jgi:hypothetical protein
MPNITREEFRATLVDKLRQRRQAKRIQSCKILAKFDAERDLQYWKAKRGHRKVGRG